MTWLKKEDEFLPNFSKLELNQLYKKEKNAKAKLRLLASIQRKEGKTLDYIASSLKKPKTTIHDWLKRLENNKIDKIRDIKQTGRPPKLSAEQKKKLVKILDDSPEKQGIPYIIWTTSLVQYIVNKLFNVLYKIRNIEYLVKEIGFTLQKPRPEHKKANKKAQDKFKKELKKKFNITLNLDSRSFVLMKRTLS